MKIEITLFRMGCGIMMPLRRGDGFPVMAELIQEDKVLGSVSVSFPYLIFDKTATRLSPKDRRQKVLQIGRTKNGKVTFITEDSESRTYWRFVSTIPAGDSK